LRRVPGVSTWRWRRCKQSSAPHGRTPTIRSARLA